MPPPRNTRLRTGFTTGAAAAAATKGALYLLLQGQAPDSVRIDFIGGGHRDIRIFSCRGGEGGSPAVATVIKDAGDDPDVTNRAEIGAWVTIDRAGAPGIHISGGRGVGRVTKPGLEIPPGQAAITAGPRRMITTAVEQVLDETETPAMTINVEIFIPEGERLAGKTLNARLGVVGGLSVLGTTGLVRPMSHEAYTATIGSALSVARAGGVGRVFLTTGRRSERFAQQHWPGEPEEAFVQIGDFFQWSLQKASAMKFTEMVLTVFFGKALKMASGLPHTHAGKADMRLNQLSQWTQEITGDRELAETVKSANTARQAFYCLRADYPAVIARVGEEIVAVAKNFAKAGVNRRAIIRVVIFDFDGQIAFDSEQKGPS